MIIDSDYDHHCEDGCDTLFISKFIRESKYAVLVELSYDPEEEELGEKLWVPKSVVKDLHHDSLDVATWWMEKQGI